jgi:hypothetical protein
VLFEPLYEDEPRLEEPRLLAEVSAFGLLEPL